MNTAGFKKAATIFVESLGEEEAPSFGHWGVGGPWAANWQLFDGDGDTVAESPNGIDVEILLPEHPLGKGVRAACEDAGVDCWDK